MKKYIMSNVIKDMVLSQVQLVNLENGEKVDTQSTHAGWFDFDLKSNEREN